MRVLTFALMISFAAFMSCASSDKTSKNDKQVLAEVKAKAEAETKKLEEEKAVKEKEEMLAKEELDKKKAESEKQREELGAVKERLKKMGLAAVYFPITRDGQVFTYPGGRTTTIKSQVLDNILLRSLNQIMDKQVEKSNSDRDYYTTGTGGFEACLNDQLYILYMSKNNNGMIIREWFEMLEKCN
jgi:hypothetical protein